MLVHNGRKGQTAPDASRSRSEMRLTGVCAAILLIGSASRKNSMACKGGHITFSTSIYSLQTSMLASDSSISSYFLQFFPP